MPVVLFSLSVVAMLVLTQMWLTNPPDKGAYAPEFRLEGIDGQETVLSDLRGAPVVVSFVSIDCQACRGAYLENISRLNIDLASRYTPVTVVEGADNAQGTLQAYRTATNGTWLYLRGTSAVNQSYKLSILPTTVVISADGIIVARHEGAVSFEVLKADVLEALA